MKMNYLYKEIRSALVMLLAMTAVACTDDDMQERGVENSERVSVQLNFTADIPQTAVSSRAPSDNTLNDLYVFIFSADGTLRAKQYYDYTALTDGTSGSQPATTGDNNWVKITTSQGESYIYGIGNVSGSTNTYDGDLKTELDGVTDRQSLLDLSVTLKEDIQRVGNTYLMAGSVNNGETYSIAKGSAVKTLKLKRLDSFIKFEFSVVPGSNCTSFSLENYQVCNVPKKTYVMDHTPTRGYDRSQTGSTWDAAINSDDFYNSDVITGTLNADKGFSFYMAENRKNGKQEITGDTEKEKYGLREKQEKTATGSTDRPTVENGAYTYAPDYGTYVVVKGKFIGKSTVAGDGNSGSVEADVRYVIHLGYVDGAMAEKANDFFSNRNTKYTYRVSISGVNDIIIEVVEENETENSPGAEGDVKFTEGTTTYNLDAHYETVLLRFSKSLLEQSKNRTDFFTYKVTTPFTKMGAVDENWIRIVRNDKNNNRYSTLLKAYPSNNYLTLPEFIEELKGIADGSISGAYDKKNEVVYTCHIDEFYYDEAPNGVTVSGDLWKRFVNTDNREVQLLNDVTLSPDGKSSITRSTYVLSQRAIQTFYDASLSESYSAYGVESVDETGPLESWEKYQDQIGVYNTITDKNAGRDNFVKILKAKNNIAMDKSWTTLVDWGANGYSVANTENRPLVKAMKGNYERAYLACLQRNRDVNGNGTIDEAEIKWYLPAVNQYVGMFLGDAGLSEEAKLYTETSYVYKHIITSTARYEKGGSDNNLVIYWGEESVSTSCNTEYGMTMTGIGTNNYYRCMRNLGSGTPKNYYSYNSSNKTITVPYLNKKTLRSSVSSGELGRQNNWEDGSRLSQNGFFYGDSNTTRVSSNVGYAMQYNIDWSANTACYNITSGGVAKGYWRAPNLRELYLMSVAGSILQAGDVSRTMFKFYNVPKPSAAGGGTYRIGWRYNGTNLTMGGGLTTEGSHIRCVRDNQ